MMSAFDFFDKIYCINLDSRPDRWQETKFELAHVGVTRYERVPGVVAASGPAGFTRAMCNAVDKALDDECAAALICEDDVHFHGDPSHINNKLRAALSQLPNDWDALYLGGTLTDEFHPIPVSGYSLDLLRLSSSFATQSVAYSRKGLQALKKIEHTSNHWSDTIVGRYGVFDVYLAKDYLSQNNCFITNELLSFQRPSYSDICKSYQNYIGLMQHAFNRFVAR